MSLRHLITVLLILCLMLVTGQVGPFRIFAGPPGNQGNPDGKESKKEPKMLPLPKPPPKRLNPPREHSTTWRDARRSGEGLSASLQRTHARPRDKDLDLGSYHVSRPHVRWMLWTPFAEIPAMGPYVRVEVFAGRSPLNIINQAPYVNTFDTARGIIGIEWDFKAYDSTPEPEQLHLSDLLYASYRHASAKREGGRHVPPKYVVVTWVITPETKRVLDEAHGDKPRRERVWLPGSPEYHAMLGTTQGKVVMHMLMDFCKWSQCRVPAAVKTKFSSVPNGPPGWFMLFELRGRNADKIDKVE